MTFQNGTNSSSASDCNSPRRRTRTRRRISKSPKRISKSPLGRIQECIDNMTPFDDGTNYHSIEIVSNHSSPRENARTNNSYFTTNSEPSSLESSKNNSSDYNVLQSSPPGTLCADPLHLHSFQQLSSISSMFKSKFITCQACNQRSLSIYDSSKNTLLCCIACGIYVHRSCLLEVKQKSNIIFNGESSSIKTNSYSLRTCTKNLELVQLRLRYLSKYSQAGIGNNNKAMCRNQMIKKDTTSSLGSNDCTNQNYNNDHDIDAVKDNVDDDHIQNQNGNKQNHTHTIKNNEREESKSNNDVHENNPQMIQISDDDYDDDDNENYKLEKDDIDQYKWSHGGPPTQHWASPETLRGIKSSNSSRSLNKEALGKDTSQEIECGEDDGGGNASEMNIGQQQNDFKTTFSNLSKALRENLLLNSHENVVDKKDEGEEVAHYKGERERESSMNDDDDEGLGAIHAVSQSTKNNDSNNDLAKFDDQTLLQEAAPKEVPSITSQVNTAVQIVKKAQSTRKSMSIASVAGTVAGGVVGLAVAGPAGAYLGSRIGQIAAGVGVLIEGSVQVGILVAGVKGTMFAVNQIHNTRVGQKSRVLTLGEAESECKVLLVRPHIIVDPEWQQINLEARKAAPNEMKHDRTFGGLNFLSSGCSNYDIAAKKGRKERDTIIANSKDNELSKSEKIFLLVSSSLNDKTSLPGFVYRYLVEAIIQRSIKRKNNVQPIGFDNEEVQESNIRGVRQDVHAVIKHVTATLLEVRPGFGASARITEMSATAVESLIFGEVYDLVYAEIIDETSERDKALEEKIQNADIDPSSAEFISEQAIESIKLLSKQHSVSEKLYCCVTMLESIAGESENQNINTDNLLKLVCQHIILANVNEMNAECVFLEEFARDEQLLRGKEGYALVTLQASLHFLNVCSDLNNDVFGVD